MSKIAAELVFWTQAVDKSGRIFAQRLWRNNFRISCIQVFFDAMSRWHWADRLSALHCVPWMPGP